MVHPINRSPGRVPADGPTRRTNDTGHATWKAVKVIIWLAAAAVTLAGFVRSRRELPEPRPGYWAMRFMLIHDTVHAR